MSNKEHRTGVNLANLMVRHLHIEPFEFNNLDAAIKEINQLYGLDDISYDDMSRVLNLAYDASRVCLDGIEDILEKHDIKVSRDWWTRFKEGYYKFVDQNVQDNAKHQPLSCHRVPPGARTKN